ncbi:MAG: membrane protein insertase YidC [Phycisphaerae bacterium]
MTPRCIVRSCTLAALLAVALTAAPALAQTTTAEAGNANAPAGPVNKWFGTPRGEQKTVTIGSLDHDKRFLLQAELTNVGAAVTSLKLRDFFTTVEDKRLWDSEPEQYERKRKENPQKYEGHYRLLQPASDARPLATRKLDLQLGRGETAKLEGLDLSSRTWVLDANSVTPGSATFTYTIYLGPDWEGAQGNPICRLHKTFRIDEEDYSLHVDLRVENLTDGSIVVDMDQLGSTGLPAAETGRGTSRRVAYAKVEENGTIQPSYHKIDDLDDYGIGHREGVGGNEKGRPVVWFGQVNRFFGCLIYPVPQKGNEVYVPAAEYATNVYWQAAMGPDGSKVHLTGVQILDMRVPAGKGRSAVLEVFCGPKKRTLFNPMFLDKVPPAHKERYEQLNYMSTMDFSTCFCAWDALTVGMMWLLDKLSRIALGNYGVGIMLLVVVVRIILHPLTKKSQISMMKMQKLGPKVNELKEKYADDKDTLNREMMSLYKEAGASPVLGCLPMFLQMPIWIGLWSSINGSVELRHAAFLPFWLTDLAAPDALITWGTDLWLIGDNFNLLPILLCVAMYLQTKLNPQMSATSTANPEQQQTQKMMRVMMPGMMLVFFYHMPAGLNLYIMASTFAGVAEQQIIRKHIQKHEEQLKAQEVRVSAPGKQSRHNRPKKPKGPFWTKKG